MTALEHVATAADEAAAEQRQVARKARTMQRQRDRGWSWGRILDSETSPKILDLLRSSAKKIAGATATLGQTLVRGLAGEGESRRRIAGRLGVTHQRITAMLRPGSRP